MSRVFSSLKKKDETDEAAKKFGSAKKHCEEKPFLPDNLRQITPFLAMFMCDTEPVGS